MRTPDDRLVRGEGSYVADLVLPGMCDVAFTRSPFASALVREIDPGPAFKFEEVIMVATGADLVNAGKSLQIALAGGESFHWVPLATAQVGFVGEPIAAVVADSRAVAEDAAETVHVEFEVTPVLGDVQMPDEEGFDSERIAFDVADQIGDITTGFAKADTVIEHTFRYARQSPLPLETRGVLAAVEPHSRLLTVWSSTQVPSVLASAIARFVGLPDHQVRVVTPDVGGGFGLKATVCGEELVVAWLAMQLRRPVRWIEDRRENLVAGYHSHDQRIRIRIGANSNGELLAADAVIAVDVGYRPGFPFTWSLEPLSVGRAILSCYHVPNLRIRSVGVRSNKPPIGPYRGVGAGAGAFAGERSIDLLANKLNLDPADVRRRNLIRADQLPYKNPMNVTLEVGDFPALFDAALRNLDYERWRAIQAEVDPDELLGIGMAVFVENSGPGSISYHQRGVTALPGFDQARIDVSEEGFVTVAVSSADAGQRHARMYTNVVCSMLPVDPKRVRVIEGDTALAPSGMGTFASRAGSVHASAVAVAAERIRNRMISFAARMLECDAEDIRSADNGFSTTDGAAHLSFEDVAAYAYQTKLRIADSSSPDSGAGGLSELAVWDGELTHPVGVHCAVVKLNRHTLIPRVCAYVAAEDFGVALDPHGAHDQIVGGVAMGMGNALFEEHHYREDGEILTSSLLDYLVPLADSEVCVQRVEMVTPTSRTHLGATGVAEAGTIGAAAAIGAAVADALRPFGAILDHLPATPKRLFDLIAATEETGSP